jgi:hypothetical protein
MVKTLNQLGYHELEDASQPPATTRSYWYGGGGR